MAYEVPALPYDYNALEPHIDEQTMRIHHDKHHQAYVDKANAALEGTEWADKPVEEVLKNLSSLPADKQGPVRNNAGGHANHIAVLDGARPGRRRHAVRRPGRRDRRPRSAASMQLKQQMIDAGVNRFGSGWSWLVRRRRRPEGDQHRQPGLADLGRPDADPGHRRVGARLLPEVPEPPARLPGRDLERRRLERVAERYAAARSAAAAV